MTALRSLALAALLLVAEPAAGQAQDPGTYRPGTPPTEAAPPAFTARGGPDAAELELQQALRGGVISGRVSIPDEKLGVLVQPQGRDWRQFRNTWLTLWGAIAVLGMLAVLVAIYLARGPTRIESGRSGRSVLRYNLLERANHWMTATSFVLLALTWLIITYGASGLGPLMSPEAFTALAYWSQAIHHFVSFAFLLGLLVMLLLWVRDNLPSRVDWAWLRAGGPLAKGHPPAGRFNAGQKLLYWVVILGGLAVAASGYMLMFPFAVTDIEGQQWAHIVHGVLGMLLIAVILGHIYLGTVGTEGAFEQMSTGRANWNYLREHHSVWLEQEVARAERAAAPSRPHGAREAGAD